MECPNENDLARFVDQAPGAGEAGQESSQAIEEHMASCASCRQLVFALASSAEAGHQATPDSAEATSIGRFEIVRELGRGAMGVVYLAHDPELERSVAIKVCTTTSAFDAELEERLRREAQSLARLSHPNVVSVHEVGSEGGQVFVVMEYVQGATLKDWLGEASRGSDEILAVFREASRGLQAAHAAGLIHRDFKPQNLMVGGAGDVKVADFGLVRLVDRVSVGSVAPSTDLHLSLTGAMLGTPAYMAPEQLRGAAATEKSDQFSFCVALYEALCGTRPFEGHSVAELRASMSAGSAAPPAPAPVHRRIRLAIVRGLAPDEADRFPSMKALHEELRPPSGRWRWGATGGVLLATAVVAAQWGLGSSEARSCSRGADQVAGIWTSAQRDSIQEAFLATKRAHAADTFQRVDRTLTRHFADWQSLDKSVCRASSDLGAATVSAQTSCLARNLRESKSFVGLLTSVTKKEVDRAVKAVSALSPVSGCEQTDLLLATNPPPTDPVVRAEIEKIQQQLADTKAQLDLGRFDVSLEDAEKLADRAIATKYQALIAEVLYAVSRIRINFRPEDSPIAEEALHQAIAAAIAAGHDEYVARGYVLLTSMSNKRRDHEKGRQWGGYAQAALDRIGGHDALRASLAYYQGNMDFLEGKHALAIADYESSLAFSETPNAHFGIGQAHYYQGNYELALESVTRALEAWTEEFGALHPTTANAFDLRGNIFQAQGNAAEAYENHRKGLELRAEAFPNSNQHAISLNNMGMSLTSLGRLDEAFNSYDGAMSIWKKLDPENRNLGNALNNIADIRLQQNKLMEGKQYLEQALALWTKTLGEGHPDIAIAFVNLGQVHRQIKDYQASLQSYRRAIEIREAAFGVDAVLLASPLTGMGETLQQMGKVKESVAVLERALTLHKAHKSSDTVAAETRFGLAKAITNRGRCLDLLAKARKGFQASHAEDSLQTLDQWALEAGLSLP